MNRIKECFYKFKELWNVPRYRGLIKLAFWFLFFLIIFGGIRFKSVISNNIKKESDIVDESITNKVTGYSYNCQINDSMNTIYISGIYNNGVDTFIYNNNQYILKDNKYYLNNFLVDFPYWMMEFQYNNIIPLINNQERISKTEYNDSTIEENYLIDSITYNNYYKKSYQAKGNVGISVKKKDNTIISISIDYSNYLDNSNIKVLVNYSNMRK